MIFLPVLTCLIISPLMQKVFHDSEEIIHYERKLKKNSVRKSHPRFCGALRKNTLAKFFLMCLSFRADYVAFVKPVNNSFLLSSSSFLIRKKKSEIFLLHASYSVKCFRNNLRYLTCDARTHLKTRKQLAYF